MHLFYGLSAWPGGVWSSGSDSHNVAGDIATLAETLTELSLREGSSLGWLEIGAGISTMHITQSVAMFLSFAASIFFFFHTRQSSDE